MARDTDALPTPDKPPPHNDEAERTVIGTILIDGQSIWRVYGWLQPSCFYDDANRQIYQVLCTMANNDQAIDLLTARDALVGAGVDPSVVVQMMGYVDSVPDIANVEAYARIVKRDYDRRRAIAACETGAMSFWNSHDVRGAAASLLDVSAELLDSNDGRKATESVRDLARQAVTSLEAKLSGDAEPDGIPTGYRSIDSKTHGLPRGAVTIIGAPPKVGKTTMLLNMALNQAELGYNVLLISIDMPKAFVRDRLLSIASGVDSEFVKSGHVAQQGLYGGLSRDDLLRAVMAGHKRLSSVAGSLDVNDSMTDVAEIIAECTLRAKRKALDVVYVDFIQQVESSASKTDSEHRRITLVANKLKNVARKLDIAMVLAAQPNRTLGKGERMRLRHLAESSSLEQVPRLALMLYRPGAETNAEELACDLKVLIEKNEGQTGEAQLHAELACYRITEREHDSDCPFERGH